jgi:F0F1-type ATP synthase membrane subunit b/b'
MPEFNATLVFIMISFVIFMVLMKVIYFDPILNIKHERERKMADDQTSARKFAEDYERIHAEYLAGLQKARKDAHQVIQEVRQQAKTSAQQALTEARANAQAETDRQMAELQSWRESTYQQLAGERDALTQAIISKVTSGRKIRTASGG